MSETTLKAFAIVLKESIEILRSELEQKIDGIDKSNTDGIEDLNKHIDQDQVRIKTDLEELKFDIQQKIDGHEVTNSVCTSELLTRTEFIGKTQKELENTLVDLEIFAREQPENMLDALTEMTKDFDHEILKRLQEFDKQLDANNWRITEAVQTVDRILSDQNEHQEKLGRDINETLIVNQESHKKDIKTSMQRLMEDLRQLSISHKTEIIGDLMTRLKGEPGDKGDQGDIGPAPNFTDEVWKDGEPYAKHDVLWKDSHSFIALADHPQGEPGKSEAWAKYTMRGQAGRRGSKGDQGNPGLKGSPGRDGKNSLTQQEIRTLVKAMVTPEDGQNIGAFRGKWSFDARYIPGDVVTFGDGSYIASESNTGKVPSNSDKWNVFGAAASGQSPTVDQGVLWTSDYVVGATYQKNQMVRDGAYTMIANHQTNERAAPQPEGDAYNSYAGTLSTLQQLAKQVMFGTRYNWGADDRLYIDALEIDVVAGNHYQIYKVKNPLDSNSIPTKIYDFTATTSGLIRIAIDKILVIGAGVFDIVAIVNEPAVTPTTWTGNWDYTTPTNEGAPLPGQVLHSDKKPDVLSWHYTDSDGGDRTTELQALTVGDVINLHSASWAIQAISDQGAYVEFSVSPAVQSSPDGIDEFTLETVSATPITVGYDADYWQGDVEKEGLYIYDGKYEDIIPDDHAYGLNLILQAATISEDWEIVAVSEGFAGGDSAEADEQSFYHQKEADVLDIGETFQEVVTLTTPDLPAGVYMIAYAFEVDFNGKKDTPAFFRLGGTFGSTAEFAITAGASDGDQKNRYYGFPKEWTGGPITVSLDFKKDALITTFDINFVDVMIEKK